MRGGGWWSRSPWPPSAASACGRRSSCCLWSRPSSASTAAAPANWSVENGRTWLWTLGRIEGGNEVWRYPFDPEREEIGRREAVLGSTEARFAETLGVARDGSAVTFASLANRRGQLLRIDGLAGLSE